MPDMAPPCTIEHDPGFKVYHQLMRYKVRDILLVHTAYDAFVMEGDGALASRIVTQYHGLNLSQPPLLTLATSAAEALELIGGRAFDLVITMPQVGEMDAFSLATAIKKARPELPVILLSHGLAPHLQAAPDAPSPLDASYVWSADPDLLLAMVKNLEDHRNAEHDTHLASVRILLLVEDSPLFRSFFLPLLYKQVVTQTQAVLDEGLNAEHRLLKMRARPKILTAASFEEAMDLYRRYQPYIYGVISDSRYPKGGQPTDDAGVALLTRIRREIADLPLLLLSAESVNRLPAAGIPAHFIDKNAPDIGEQVQGFFLEHLGFGDFVFKDRAGHTLERAVNLIDFERKLRTVDDEALFYHARHNHFSNWIMARTEVRLAGLCQRQALSQFTTPAALRRHLTTLIRDELRRRQRGIVTQFSERDFDAEIMEFVRCGKGAMGGKALGLAFLANYLRLTGSLCGIDAVRVAIPRTVVITSDWFDGFIREHGLDRLDCQSLSDAQISEAFADPPLPEGLRRQLTVLLAQSDYPLIVRSSSVLEDAHFAPYAGLFTTVPLANDHPDPGERLRQLERAVKRVYASALHAGPLSFAKARQQQRPGSMAVMVQQLAGHRYGGFFYPALSGVAQSRNFYPLPPMRAEEGIAHIALGLGKTVVAGEQCLNFSPAHPKLLPQLSTVQDIVENAQQTFHALPLHGNGRRAAAVPVRRRVTEAMAEYPLQLLCSSYSAEDQRIRDSRGTGVPVLTFANILKHNLIPLPLLLQRLLEVAKQGCGGDVEIEFALDVNDGSAPPTFSILQLRPQATVLERQRITITAADKRKALLFSTDVLGHGRLDHIADIVYVDPATFRGADSRLIAQEIGRINARLDREQRGYLLIGPGRWGSADPMLGIPVRWQEINAVSAMVELRGEAFSVDPSQGTHFFQNITASHIHYISLDSRKGHILNHKLLAHFPLVSDQGQVRHLRLAHPLVVKTDNHSGQCVIYP